MMPVGMVMTGNQRLLIVLGRRFLLRHFPAARSDLDLVRAHLAGTHKGLLEHRSDHVEDAPQKRRRYHDKTTAANRPNVALHRCNTTVTAGRRLAGRNAAGPAAPHRSLMRQSTPCTPSDCC